MRLQLLGAGVLVAAGALALWRWEVAATELKAEQARATALEQRIVEKDAELERLGGALQDEMAWVGALVEIERGVQSLRQEIEVQAAEQRDAFGELKRNDEAVRNYLGRGVPEPIGLFYQRPATTDPAAYRAGGGVPAGSLPAASAGSVAD